MHRSIESHFRRYRDRGDLAALEEVFQPVELDVTLPAEATLRGRIADLDPLGFAGWRVVALRAAHFRPRLVGGWPIGVPSLCSSLEADGTFELGPVPLDDDVHLFLARTPRGISERGVSEETLDQRVPIEVVRAPAPGPWLRSFRLGDEFPGRIELRLEVEGGEVAEVTAVAHRVGPDGEHRYSRAEVDETGRALLGPLAPGRWEICLRSKDRSWVAGLERGTVASGEVLALEAAVRLVASELAFAYESGFPAAGVALEVGTSAGAVGAAVRCRTDGEGRVALLLPEGATRVRSKEDDVRLDAGSRRRPWPPRSGAAILVRSTVSPGPSIRPEEAVEDPERD